jgi:hypothetical protein
MRICYEHASDLRRGLIETAISNNLSLPSILKKNVISDTCHCPGF